MPVTIKSSQIKVKGTDGYVGVDALADSTTASRVAAITSAGASALEDIQSEGQSNVSAIEQKGAEVLESIPEEYTQLEEDVSDLKSAVTYSNNALLEPLGFAPIAPTGHGWIPSHKSVGETIDITDVRADANKTYWIVPCTAWDVFTITAVSGGSSIHIWSFLDTNNVILLNAKNASVTADKLVLTAPENSAKLLIEDSSGATQYAGVYTPIDSRISENETNIDNIRYQDIFGEYYNTITRYITGNGDLEGSSNWRCYYYRTKPLSKISLAKSFSNSKAYYQIAFYSSYSPSSATFISGYKFESSNSESTLTDITIPANAVLMLFTDRPGSETAIELKGTITKPSPDVLKIEKSKFDGCFNFIPYSGTRGDNNSINTAEHYRYAGQRGIVKSIKGDVRPTSDGGIIMCHDAGFTLDASGNIINFDPTDTANTVYIHDMTTQQCLALKYAGTLQSVCSFDEYIRICKLYGKNAFITIRVEEYVDDYLGDLFDILDKYHMRNNAIFNTYSMMNICKIRDYDETIMVSWVHTYASRLTTDMVDACMHMGNCYLTGFVTTDSTDTIAVVTQYSDVIDYANENNVRVQIAIVYSESITIEQLLSVGVVGAQYAYYPSNS